MKHKSTIPKRSLIPKEVSLPDPPLKTDELLDFFERSYKNDALKTDEVVDYIEQSQKENYDVSNLLHDLIPVLLFVQGALDQESSIGNLHIYLRDRDVEYCSLSDGAAKIMEMISARLFEAANASEGGSFHIESAVEKYRKVHPKIVSA
jgi:hypothetical protein